MIVSLNGQLKDSKEAVISAFDHGFLYGMGLFETFRTYGGEPWLIDRHAARLTEGCRELGIVYEADAGRMRDVVSRLLRANGLADAYVRWSVSAGEGAVGLPANLYESPSEIVYMKELGADHPDTRLPKPLRLLRIRRSSPEGGNRLKSFHYMNNILAKRELAAAGTPASTEGLFLDDDGYVCEGIVSNIFWLKEGVLYTSSLETGPLAGITRYYLMGLAGQAGITVREGKYALSEIVEADEAFLTNSVQEIVPVNEFLDAEGRVLKRFETNGEEGSLARKLMMWYRMLAEGGQPDEAFFS